MSPIFASPRFLPRVMALDAVSCLATGALQLAAAAPMAALTGLPESLLLGTGAFLLVYGLVAAWIARRPSMPRTLIGLIAVGNVGWAAGCTALLVSGVFPVTALGIAWVAMQAVVVLLLADAQWMGLRATRGAPAAQRPSLA